MLGAVDPASVDPWAFQAHPEVWLLVGSLIGLYVYAVRVIGPTVVPAGQPVVTRRQIGYFVAAIAMLEVGSDWPLHDVAEKYLYSAHMLQHMMLSYFMPPLVLLAMPEWFMRLLFDNPKAYAVLKFLTKPVIAGLAFNLTVMTTHIPGLVNRSAENTPLHYLLHVLLVSTALLMWMPVVGPFKELHLSYGARMIYLFLQSVVPTVPAGWLTFADGVVYKHYNIPERVWGLSATHDQQIAGAIMKIGGGFFLWGIVIYYFFGRFSHRFRTDADQSYRRSGPGTEVGELASDDEPLTYEQVTAAFERAPAIPESPWPPPTVR